MNFKINLPVDQYEIGISEAKKAIKKLKVINALRANIEPEAIAVQKRGEAGRNARNQKIAELEAEKEKIISETLPLIETAKRKANQFLQSQITPNGDDITGGNAGDYQLLQHGLVETAEQLETMLDRHPNIAFLAAAKKYCSGLDGWKEHIYDAFGKSKAAKEMDSFIFEGLETAIREPDGFRAMQLVCTPGEYERLAKEHGLSEEFALSEGTRIKAIIETE